MQKRKKTRNLDINTYFDAVQIEFTVCKLRSTISKNKSYANWWEEIAEKKRKIINDISKRYTFDSIFNSDDVKKIIDNKVFNKIGLPNFIYNDEKRRNDQRDWDIYNYYTFGDKKVKVFPDENDENNCLDGTIKFVNFKTNIAEVIINDEIKLFNYNRLTRIF